MSLSARRPEGDSFAFVSGVHQDQNWGWQIPVAAIRGIMYGYAAQYSQIIKDGELLPLEKLARATLQMLVLQ